RATKKNATPRMRAEQSRSRGPSPRRVRSNAFRAVERIRTDCNRHETRRTLRSKEVSLDCAVSLATSTKGEGSTFGGTVVLGDETAVTAEPATCWGKTVCRGEGGAGATLAAGAGAAAGICSCCPQ